MYSKRLRSTQLVPYSLFAVFLAFGLAGCGTSLPGGSDSNARTRPAQDSEMPPVRSPVPEDPYNNESFDEAQPATLPDSGEIVIEGAIDASGDIDVYKLGSAIAGDRIIIDVTGNDGLNTVAALFDADGNLIDANDDRSYYGGLVDPYISQVIQVDTSQMYIGIAVSTARHFASSQGRYDSGSYSIRVRRETGAPLREARRQVVYLDFEGGASVQIGLEPIVVMQPFSAESISGRLAGQTAYIVGLIMDHLNSDYGPFNIVLLDSKHYSPPAEEHTTLYFGNYNASYLGLADNVDTGNVYLRQEAIIYSEDLALWESLQPSADEVAQALANIAAHELGHLVGLEHNLGSGDIMATAGSARQVLEVDAGFTRSELQRDVFPIGYQDEVAILYQNLGPNPSSSGARQRTEDLLPRSAGNWRDQAGIPDIPITQKH